MPTTTQSASTQWERPIAVLTLVGGMSSFEIGAALARHLFWIFGVEGMVGLRVNIAAFLLLLLYRPNLSIVTKKTRGILLIYGAAMAAMNFGFYVALSRLPLGLVVSIEFIGPLSLAIFGSRRKTDIIWIGFILLGLALLLRPDQAFAHLDLIGLFAAIMGACGWTIYIVSGSRIVRVMPARQATAFGMTVAAVFLFPFFIPSVPAAIHHPPEAVAALGVAILSSAVPYTLDMMAMRKLSPRDMGILLSLEPVIGSLSGLFLLGQNLSFVRWVGVFCIVFASAGNVLSARPKRRDLQPILTNNESLDTQASTP